MDYDKFFQHHRSTTPTTGRRSSFMIIKNDQIMSADDYFMSEMKKKAVEAESHRQRSFSAGALSVPPRTRSRIPNFKKVHEQQFGKMESLADYTARKAERAKMLLTPPRLVRPSPPPSPPAQPAFKRTLSVNYKNSLEVTSKRFKADPVVTAVRPISPTESMTSSICSKTTSWLKGVKLNRQFQLLLNSKKR
jgi:hypothetical protein